tara:strand:- start:14216 stop:14497 length:282 start_codon:yes stop_codon:yes gene_type:complete
MRALTGLILGIAAISLIGCGDEIRGTYSDAAGVTQYAFGGDGQVTIQVLGTKVNAEYRLDDDKVLVSSAQGTVVLTLRDDRLYGPMGLELTRQ